MRPFERARASARPPGVRATASLAFGISIAVTIIRINCGVARFGPTTPKSVELNLLRSVRRHRRALAIVALLSQDHFSEKADMVACSALNSFEERAPNTGEVNTLRNRTEPSSRAKLAPPG